MASHKVYGYAWSLLFRFSDLLLVAGGAEAVLSIAYGGWPPAQVQAWVLSLVPAALLCFTIAGCYNQKAIWHLDTGMRRLALAWAGTVLLSLLGAYFVEVLAALPRFPVAVWLVLTTIVLVASRVVLQLIVLSRARRGVGLANVILAGTRDESYRMARLLQRHREYGLRAVAFAGFAADDEREPELAALPHYEDLKDLAEACEEHAADQVHVCAPMISAAALVMRVNVLLDRSSTLISYVPDVSAYSLFCCNVHEIAGRPVIDINGPPIDPHGHVLKTILDYVLASVILVGIAPLMLLIAVAIKATSPGPVLFKQMRHGLHGRPIRVYKFRTMRSDVSVAASDGTECKADGRFAQATHDDPRVTPIGRLLRRTSLDELPQFINVLEGKMSIVGPRPHAIKMNKDYAVEVTRLMKRHCVKPGITGLAQINGLRGETGTMDKMRKRIAYDLDYIRTWSIWQDLKIILLTPSRGLLNRQP